jgi:hypothetical protein
MRGRGRHDGCGGNARANSRALRRDHGGGARGDHLLIDLGASSEEIEAAIGPDGYARRMLREDRDAQIREVARWLAGGTLH